LTHGLFFSYTATADSTSTTLTFSGGNDVLANYVDDISVVAGGSANGDPHFIGFDGVSFDFMGKADLVFPLFSSQDLQVNARFKSAEHPQFFNYSFAPTFMGEIGISQGDSNWIVLTHAEDPKLSPLKEVLPSNNQQHNNAPLTFLLNNAGVAVWYPPATLVVSFPQYIITVTRQYEYTQLRSDVYEVYMGVSMVLTPEFRGKAHGLLGQTMIPLKDRSVGIANSLQGGGVIEGTWEDYIVHSGNLFGTDFAFSQFNKSTDTAAKLNSSVSAIVKDAIMEV